MLNFATQSDLMKMTLFDVDLVLLKRNGQKSFDSVNLKHNRSGAPRKQPVEPTVTPDTFYSCESRDA